MRRIEKLQHRRRLCATNNDKQDFPFDNVKKLFFIFQSITGIEDLAEAIYYLEESKWDLIVSTLQTTVIWFVLKFLFVVVGVVCGRYDFSLF